jgi:LacI family transcriptional regulator
MGTRKLQTVAKVAGRVRMIDVARAAGVSRPTVSYVLNGCRSGQTRVKPETAEKIRRIARQLKFHPNHAAQQLAGQRSGVVAVLAENFFSAPHLRALSWLNHVGSERGLETLGWEAGIDKFSIDDYVSKCLAWNVDGLIFVALSVDVLKPTASGTILRPEAVKALSRFSRIVSLFNDPGIPGGYCVDYDSGEGVRQAVTYLHAQGRRKIVQILESLDTTMSRRRHEGFVAAHRELGRPWTNDQICVATSGWDRDDFPKFAALCDELVDERGADAILADNDGTAAFMAKALARRGLRVPDDVAVVGWGNETLSAWMNPGLTTVNYRMKDMVTAALDLLTELIERPEKPHERTICIKPDLVIRESA